MMQTHNRNDLQNLNYHIALPVCKNSFRKEYITPQLQNNLCMYNILISLINIKNLNNYIRKLSSFSNCEPIFIEISTK